MSKKPKKCKKAYSPGAKAMANLIVGSSSARNGEKISVLMSSYAPLIMLKNLKFPSGIHNIITKPTR